MDTTRLKTFRVVSELLSFRKAAREIHLTQPAVTAHIKALEESLGVALFNRDGKSISLTRAGEMLLVYARKIEDLNNQAIASLASFGAHEKIEISVGASHAVGTHLLPAVLPALLEARPGLRVHIHTGSTSEVLNNLTTYRIHIGIIDAPALRPDLAIEKFAEDELVLIVPADHPWANRSQISTQELASEKLLLREPGSGSRAFVENFLEAAGVRSQVQCDIDINSVEALIACVEAGTGVGFVPRLAVEKSLRTGSVKTIPVEGGPIRQPLSIILRKGLPPQGPLQQLIEILRSSSYLRSSQSSTGGDSGLSQVVTQAAGEIGGSRSISPSSAEFAENRHSKESHRHAAEPRTFNRSLRTERYGRGRS